MSSVLAMVASCGCAVITSCKGQPYVASTSGVSEFKGTEQQWRRRFTVDSVCFGSYGRSRLLPHKPSSVHLSHTFVTKKSAVAFQASNARVSASKDKNNREPDKSRNEGRIKGKDEEQEGKTRISSADSSESSSIATRKVVVKDGFAGLSALKAKLEQQRPRISRVKDNDVSRKFLPQQKHRAEIRRRQEAVKTPTSPKYDDSMTTGSSTPSELISSDGPIRDGVTTTKAAAEKQVPLISSSSSSSVKKELSKVTSRVKRQGGGLRDIEKVQPSSMETDATELRSAKGSSQNFRTPNGGKMDGNLKNRAADMDFSSVMDRDTAEMGRSSTNVDTSKGLDSQSATKLSGQSVLEALQRAAAQRDNKLKSRRKGRSGGGRYNSDSDSDEDSRQDPLPPLVFKPEWASKIEELENDLKQLRMLS